jgi:acyl-CoA synthetase (AMP-forming)/AMP-acid ligase II/acyl carrier protein
MSVTAIGPQVARQARARPGTPAVVGDGESLTWGDLARLAASVARGLRIRVGSRPRRVAVLARHAPPGVAAMVGTLDSGHVLVPLGPHESDGYLLSVLDDAAVAAVVADAALAGRAARLAGSRALLVVPELFGDAGDAEAGDLAPAAPASPDDALAAIVYTSGTTGKPKGVMTTRGAIAERVRQYSDVSGIGPGDRQASIIPWHFSAAFPDVWGALHHGASLHLYDAHRRGVEQLGAWIREREITLLNLPVALLRRLLEPASVVAFPTVRLVNASGDRLDAGEARALLRLLPEAARLVYGYGCTEANLVAQAVFDRAAAESLDDGPLPPGRPVAGKTVLVLDGTGLPRTDDGDGELGVVAPRLSPGYWDRPAATARTFLPTAGGRIYRSGDLGRIRGDGTLVLLGRAGRRVKLRGQRLDLDAVESMLRGLGTLRNAVVEASAGPGGETRLVAWVEPVTGEPVSGPGVQRAVRSRAPEHWVPARVVIVPALPLTATGKVDRAALPPPDAARPVLDAPFRSPRNELETLLAQLWAEQLELDRVGVDDPFFDLGGDSLALAALASRVEVETGRKPHLEALPGNLTVAMMASLLSSERTAPPTERRRAPAIHKRRRGRRSRHFRLVHVGPLVGGYALPYTIGVRLQRSWLSRSGTRRRHFSEPLALVRRWHERLGTVEPFERTAMTSLMANTWGRWRARALNVPSAFARWVTVEGERHLREATSGGRGAVLVVLHTGFGNRAALLRHLAPLDGREVLTIRRPRPRAASELGHRDHPELLLDRTIEFQRARETLSRGGAAVIAGDGTHGAAAVEIPFHGHLRRFRIGPAELAVSSGAALVPVFTSMTAAGRARLVLEEPLSAQGGSARERAVALTRLYAARLERAWPEVWPSLHWGELRRALDPPPWY